MFVMTAKLSKSKLFAAGLILLAAIILIVVFVTAGGGDAVENTPVGETNDDRVAYLASFGWSVNAQPKQTQQVKIPDSTENKVFARYNELQISQGFDLTKYAGKEATRYVYEILNYPEAKEPVYASILVYDGKIIGGDITDSSPNGLIHGFQIPSGANSGASEEAQEPTSAEANEETGISELPSEASEEMTQTATEG